MTKQVALADATYARLKAQKGKGESFSDVIDRLIGYAPKDPMGFLRNMPKPVLSSKKWLEQIEADREATRVKA